MRSYDKGLNNALTLIKKIYKNVWHTKERATDKKSRAKSLDKALRNFVYLLKHFTRNWI